MPLEPGSSLGPYAVTAKIGEGGMGEVWQARDTKLDRDVALKVLPEAFTSDPDRLARFEREAKVLASLNHPNIGSIYGLEEADGVKALVLELVEGPTLADRIKQGPIPIDEALPIAKQIAEAIEAAHEAGVIHRDLKPANIKVKDDGTVKVLDFGLAKAFDSDGAEMAEAPTETAATRAGAILGTPAYMAPEQAKGLVVDRRSDIWAFGVVLYEMLTGRRAFAGDDKADTLSAVLRAEPDWDAFPGATPARLRQVVTACLEKDRRQRVHDMADVRLAMDGRFEAPATVGDTTGPGAPVWQRPFPLVAAAVALVLITAVAVWRLVTPTAAAAPVTRFIIPLTDVMMHGLAVSPLGDRVVYSAPGADGLQLFVRFRDQIDAVPLRGTEGAAHPFFSPDGQWVGFSTTGELRRVPVDGGPVETLCELDGHRGVTWGPDNTIVFAPRNTPDLVGLMRVSGSGGEPQPLTSPAPNEGRHAWPQFTPDGRFVLFTTGPDSPVSGKRVALLSLDTGEQTVLVAGTGPSYIEPGLLVFARDESLWAARLDLEGATLTSEPVPVVQGVTVVPANGAANYATAPGGVLAYRAAGSTVDNPGRTPVWVDRQGNVEPLGFPPQPYRLPRLSPDGSRVAVVLDDADNPDIWVLEIARGILTRVTRHPGRDLVPLWTPDGQAIVFQSDRDEAMGLFRKAADGRGDPERLFVMENTNLLAPAAWTPDEQSLVFTYRLSERGYNEDLGILTLTPDPDWRAFAASAATERAATLSPDGAWLAYASDETGRLEIFVDSFPGRETHQQVSIGGGRDPVWSEQGGELVYRDRAGAIVSVPVETDPTLTFGTPVTLFEDTYYRGNTIGRHYDVALDGERLLMLTAPDAPVSPIHVVVNWFEELQTRVTIP